jgi:hypothetical protein
MGVDGVIFWFERPGARQAQNDCTRGRLCVADQSNTFPRYSPEAKRKQKKSGADGSAVVRGQGTQQTITAPGRMPTCRPNPRAQ